MSDVVELADLAAEQWGFVTTAQARSRGVSAQSMARLARQGLLERLSHGVYRMAGSADTALEDLKVAWLALEPGRVVAERVLDAAPAVVSHRSAALAHGLGDLDADELEFTTVGRKQSRRPDVRLHRGEIAESDWSLVSGLPVTTPARTIEDLAIARTDGGHLAGVVRDAVAGELVDVDAVVKLLRPYAHLYGEAPGDGEGLLRRFLEEAGMPVSLTHAVELADPNIADARAVMAAFSAMVEPLREVSQVARSHQLQEASRALEAARSVLSVHTRTAAVAETVRDLERHVNFAALREASKLVDSPEFRRAAEAARRAQGQARR